MLKLVLKDFRACKMYLMLLLIILAAISVGYSLLLMSGDDLEDELYVIVVAISAMVASKLFTIMEVESGVSRLFASFPVNRKQLVVSKYLSSLLMISLVLLVHFIAIQLTATNEMRAEKYIMYYPEMWIISLLVLILSDAISLPFYFKYGLLKGGVIYSTIMILFFFTTVFVFGQLNKGTLFSEVIKSIITQPAWMLISELIILFMAVIAGSILISIKAYKYQDL